MKRLISILITVIAVWSSVAAQHPQYILRSKHFREISVTGRVNVDCRWVPDSAGLVVLNASSDALQSLKIFNAGQALNINLPSNAPKSCASEISPIVVYLTGPVDVVSLTGQGSLTIDDAGSTGHDVALVLTGSGSIKINEIKAAATNISLSGSGRININGSVSSPIVNCNLAGSGRLNASGITAQTLNATLQGSGQLALSGSTVHSSLTLRGTGTINAGALSAQSVKASVLESGEIIYSRDVQRLTTSGRTSSIKPAH